jgi:hypothetical protein
LAAFQSAHQELTEQGITTVAASVDTADKASATVGDLSLAYPVGYGLPLVDTAALLGAFYETRRSILHATGFVVRPGGAIAIASYSSGAIGRLMPDDIVRLVGFWQSKEARPQ